VPIDYIILHQHSASLGMVSAVEPFGFSLSVKTRGVYRENYNL